MSLVFIYECVCVVSLATENVSLFGDKDTPITDMWVTDGCVLVVAGYSDSCIVCVQSCRKAEAFAGQTGERGHTCVYMWHTVPYKQAHTPTPNTSTMHTMNALKSLIKVEY